MNGLLEREIAMPATARHTAEHKSDEADDHIGDVVARNLVRLRMKRQLTLDALAKLSGVSRAMLAQIEAGRSIPTIRVLCKVARALQVSVAAFTDEELFDGVAILPFNQASHVIHAGGSFISRALSPADCSRNHGFFELRLSGLALHEEAVLAPGTLKNLVVNQGVLEVTLAGQRHVLGTGDAILFYADLPHSYRNPASSEALIYQVTTLPAPTA